MSDSLDNRNDIITDLLIGAFDLGKLMQEYEAHYQRGFQKGFEAGKGAVTVDPGQLKAEFERGRESYRDELLAELQTKHRLPPATPSAPLTKAVEEMPAVKSVAISAPSKNLGGAPSKSGRPDSIPTNQAMALEAIKELGGRASAPQIRDYCRKKYWSGMPDHWTACLYDQAGLGRDGINFVPIAHVEPKVLAPSSSPQTPAKPRNVAPASTAPRPQAPIPFEHKGRSAMLATPREYSMASRLKKAMGTGHVAEAFLAQNVIGSNTEHTRMLVKDLCLGMNPALLSVGLKIEHYPGFGLLMKDAG